MATRHGLICGATGTGKTVTVQTLAENFSARGIPVFVTDIKGDLGGLSQPGGNNPKIIERARELNIDNFRGEAYPVVFWDVFGEQGHRIRATVSELGPLLLANLLELNTTQAGVLNMIFKIADDNGLLLLDLNDLRAMLQYVADNADQFKTQYGNISTASAGNIQRNLLALESQGVDKFFGEPALNVEDFLQTDNGRGVVNILAADKLMQKSLNLYATLLLWVLLESFESFQIGDPENPRLVLFFDEAHLLFRDISAAVEQKIEQILRQIGSMGIGVYFVTHDPLEIPDVVLAQLGNRVQHALRAFTRRDQKAVKVVAETLRENPEIETEVVLTELAIGEALVSMLDENGSPEIVQRAKIVPPKSQVGAITQEQRREIISSSAIFGHYEKVIDRESAFEKLQARVGQNVEPPSSPLGRILNSLTAKFSPAPIQEATTTRYTSRGTDGPAEQSQLVKTAEASKKSPPTVRSLLQELNALTGLTAVKREVQSLVNYLRVQRLRFEQGLPTEQITMHLVFTGNPGTGKTTVARLLAKLYQAMGFLTGGQLLETDRSGLVAGYLGQTAIKTLEVVKKALGGVLFIDEAYALAPAEHGVSGGDLYGQEAIETLLKAMEDNRDRLVVIVAGYTAPMKQFLASNPGLQSRFTRFIEFPDYSPKELLQIFTDMSSRHGYTLGDNVSQRVGDLLEQAYQKRGERFGNARLVRTMFERATVRLSDRLAQDEDITRDELTTFCADDIELPPENC